MNPAYEDTEQCQEDITMKGSLKHGRQHLLVPSGVHNLERAPGVLISSAVPLCET